MRYALALLLTLALGNAEADATCRHFFVKHHAVAVQQVVAVQPVVLYQAGADIQEAALVEKIARRVAQLTAAAPQSIPQTASPSAFAKCASCHSAANPSAGLIFDGTQTYDCETYAAWGRMAGLGEGVPDKMRAVIGSLSPEEKGAINEAILRSLKLPANVPGELK